MDIASIAVAEDHVTLTLGDGTTKVYAANPVVADEDVEVDIITASGVKKTFVVKQ